MAPSSSGPGCVVLSHEIEGSNPFGATNRMTKSRVHSQLWEWAFDFYEDLLLVGVHNDASEELLKHHSSLPIIAAMQLLP